MIRIRSVSTTPQDAASASKLSGQSQVLIIGAGPAGCAAGMVLAQAGMDVCVVDRAQFPRDKVCGDAVSNGGLALLRELHASDEVLARPHTLVTRASVVFPDGQRVDRDYDQPGMVIERYQLDDALRVSLERSGARLLQGVAIRHLLQDQGAVVGAEGPSITWHAPITIAADGPNSLALAALAAERPRGPTLAVSSTAYMRGVSFPAGVNTADHYLERELPMGYGWIFPDILGRANVGVYQRADAYKKSGHTLKEAFDAFLARHPERFSNATMDGALRTWSLPLSQAPHPISGPGLLLAGDAGGFVDPLSGEGIWQALFTGVRAARTALDALAQKRPLSRKDRLRYELACQRSIGLPSRGKRALQHALTAMIDSGAYRSRSLRALLRAAYAGGVLEMTKH